MPNSVSDTSPSPSLKTYLALGTTVVLWSSAFVGIRAGLISYDPGSLALFRYLIASVCMVFIYLRLKEKHQPSLKEMIAVFITGLVGFAIYNVTLNYGEIKIDSGTTSFIMSQIPTGIAILAVLFLKEEFGKWGWIGLSISVAGVALIAFSQHAAFHLSYGLIFLLIATFCGAFYSVYHKPLLRKFHPIELTAYAIWSGTFCMLIYLPHLYHEIPKASFSATLACLYLGIFPAAIGYITWSYAVSHMQACKAGSYLYLMPIIATLLGWIILQEIPTMLTLIGGTIALIGAFIINKRKYKPANSS